MRVCGKCETDISDRNYRARWCVPCAKAKKRERGSKWVADNPEKVREIARKHYEANREKSLAYSQWYRKANPEKVQESARKYHKDNLEKVREKNRQYRKANPDKERERVRKYQKDNPDKERERARKYHKDNLEKVREKNRQYRKANPDKERERKRQYREANPDKVREISRRRRARERNQMGIVTRTEAEILESQGGRCAGPGCGIRIEFGSIGGAHLDHYIPFDKGGLHDDANLQILCQPCNNSKGAKDPIEWAQSRGSLL